MLRSLIVLSFVTVTAACSTIPMVDAPSKNKSSRIHFLVLHFTSEHFAESMRLLTGQADSPVSVHYVVPEPGDETYPDQSLRVYRLVPEPLRARHAGVSHWAGAQSLNDTSIGIEIVNRSTCVNEDPDAEIQAPEQQICNFLAFPDEQVDLVIRLAKDILARNPDISPVDVIGHGDIAPRRRLDPGPLFPWKRLYDNGIGAWYDEETVAKYQRQFEADPPNTGLVQRALRAYGYNVDETGENDAQTRFSVRAFQMHFRPGDYSGQADVETASILFSLLEKYRSSELRRVLQIVTEPASDHLD